MTQPSTSIFQGFLRLCALGLALLGSQAVAAQTYSLPLTGTTTVTTCAGTLYDNGGANAPYSNYASGGTTIVPATAGNKIRLQFNTFSVDPYYDVVRVYDGSSTAAPLIGEYSNYNLPPASVYATNSAGSLTVVLQSDSYYNLNGFDATISCVTSVPLADLAVQGASANPLSTVAGNTVALNCSIYNIGAGSANSSSVGYYLSTDATLDAGDQLLGNSVGYALNSGQSSTRYATVTIPAGTAAGSYYLLFAGDYLGQVSESNETNNVAVVSFNVTPPSIDLTIQQAVVSPTNTAAGSPLNMSCYINNQGNAPASSSSVGFYFSTNATLDAGDQLLTSQYGTQLYPTYPVQRYGTAAVPTGIAPGTYYILFVADYQGQVGETNETNNVAAVSFTVSPPGVDLTIQQEYLYQTTTTAGNTIQASCLIANLGNQTATSSTAGFYLSTNQTFDASDVLLSTIAGGTLAPNLTSSRYATAVIPTTTAAGNYYVLFVADPTNAVSETNETNNVRSLLLTVLAPTIDLTVTNVYLSPVSTVPGGATASTVYMSNLGNALASPATLGYYLSTNQTLDANDVLLGNTTGTVTGYGYATRYANLTVPASTATGTYYVLAVADYLSQVAETNENNNVLGATLLVVAPGVDLTMGQPYLSTNTSAAGNTIGSNCYIQNTGNTTASSSNVGYYLSTNQTLDVNDVLLLNSPGGTLTAGNYFSRYDNLTIPGGTAAGSYYVLFVADPTNAVSETNENNNVVSTPLLLLTPGVDLLMLQPQLSATSITPGFSVTAGSSIQNAGTTTATSSNVGYYLSTNATFDANDVLLTTTAGTALGAGQSVFRSANLVIPTTTAAGNYYVLFVADPTNTVSETNENNNVASVLLTVTGPFTGTVVPYTGSATITTCATTIYDNGGFSNYADGSNGTLTILPGTAGAMVQLLFTSLATESGYDYVSIYNGTSTTAPLLGSYTGTQVPLAITATNAAGALTVLFYSDGSVTGAGFEAAVNCVAAPQPDLLLIQIGASPSSVPAGNNISLTATIANQGGGPASSSAVGYYLSTDQTLDANDRLLGTSAGASLGANLDDTRQLAAPVPANVTPGSYYVLFVADPLNVVSELNENNNVAAQAVTITRGLASRDQTAGYTVSVAPNPVASGRSVRVLLDGAGPSGKATAALYNALGQQILSQPVALGAGRGTQVELPTQGLSTGVYMLRLTGAGLSVTRRVVIE